MSPKPGCRSRTFVALLSSLLGFSACERQPGKGRAADRATPAASQLDGMQLNSARRVALESAKEAMQRGDPARLKQLGVWVRHRADVPILPENDLAALDLAITCLEQPSARDDALAKLDRLSTSTLRRPAREACLGKAPP